MDVLPILIIMICHQVIGRDLIGKDISSSRFRRDLFSISGNRTISNNPIPSSAIICSPQSLSAPLRAIVIGNLGSINAATMSLPNQTNVNIGTANVQKQVLLFPNPPPSQCYLFNFSSSTSPINPNDINNLQAQFFYDSGNTGGSDSRSVGSSNGFGSNPWSYAPNTNPICGTIICRNGGTCGNKGANGNQCQCPSSDYWLGNDCSIPNPCMQTPCYNGGQCYYLPNASYYCRCSAAYTGANCQFSSAIIATPSVSSYEPCQSTNLCLNGGTCLRQNNLAGFICRCLPGYTGANCQLSNYPSDGTAPSPNTCGISSLSFGRIVGGTPVTDNSWPWIVSIQTKSGGSHFCGGTLIGTSHVVTAAHCFDQLGTTASQFKIVAGLLSMRQRFADGVQERDVERVVPHNGYNNRALVNDIAIIKLRTPVQISKAVSPICLPNTDSSQDPQVGQTVLIAGWGFTDNIRKQVADQLQMGMIQMLNFNDGLYGRPGCRSWIEKGYPLTNNQQICAMSLDTRTDSCKGDSGGPLIGYIKSQWYLFGVVSFGDEMCASSAAAGVYTRVSAYIPWIRQQLQF